MPDAVPQEAHRNGQPHLPEILRHPLTTLQGRLDALELEARGRIRRALSTGNVKLLELDGALARVATDDWSAHGVRRHLDDLRARAGTLREAAVKRVAAMPGEAVTRLASGTRAPIQNLARGLAEAARRLDAKGEKGASTPQQGE